MSVESSVLGFPRIGANREIKKAVEAYWGGKSDAEAVIQAGKETRNKNWQYMKNAGITHVPSGDFTFYDHVLDHIQFLGATPERYSRHNLTDLDTFFAMGRGRQVGAVDEAAMEMKKWFDSNYHYIVPELSENTKFQYRTKKIVDEYKEAKNAGVETRPVLLGPISFLLLGKAARDASPGFEPISLLDKLVPVYEEILKDLKAAGAQSVQIDEPILVLDKAAPLAAQFKSAYAKLGPAGPAVTLASYYGRLDSNLEYVKDLPVAAIHADLDREPAQLDAILNAIKDKKTAVSLGVVSGRNIWKTDLEDAQRFVKKATDALGADRVMVASSSTLLHTPVDLNNEKKLKPEIKDWFSFARQKVNEIALLGRASNAQVSSEDKQALEENKASIKRRRDFETQSNDTVRNRVANITPEMLKRKNPFPVRREAQRVKINLPKFPTTTIGSFPQTQEIRIARQRFTKGEITEQEYDDFIAKEIQQVVKVQEEMDLDLLVHGEPERNDMVQYFGEQLEGVAFTTMGWVQSYGSRYVRPPIIVSDVSRPSPMTVRWSKYSQEVSSKPMKGMLTGPVTILAWSFPRADVSKEIQSKQIALALRDEVVDLEKAGIKAIQVDEPAIREGMPLRQGDWAPYLQWAVDSFRLSTSGVEDGTQTHSHFCYSDFNDIFSSIKALDADVISIEASKSDMKLLKAFQDNDYSNEIGPGVWDIHSPRVPPLEEMKQRITDMLKLIPADKLIINPDCGLKTRHWAETKASLLNLVAAAKWARENY
ncbi:hypothetical protein E3P92_02046 [Wallemia ichthyophaga]|uniref:5-methyltetrahydropteroyltriglutamate--homocysteine S-methyltransferase n=2 Tax=Wallemia ichthyophaga TaxID=245174 RepID=A0A4T0KID0_WALIC|nr:putative 5-methyltetrahydropteroyltriglutamate--homocysteine methyltransferase [Wallemia ichthyophaga EXF-994]TIA72103.1 hypothetical protein E3P91_02197 [Wallemia ichthyophaga]EOQ99854.1 putative 5-methyltetrahydropteroyltriglutamate--homocysteine methyltransferase [Wallemia ichthyophaga EXF-994]TIA84482.1 hypothetical protein E3P98_00064 [Wallemia ichthyophaga]TIA94032.1 hypothetical protein E3P97_00477 [Wallemia ichthyophaga]TIB04426.1 hypothetical protein E3P95_00285 [Wallemia ichthyoph